MSRAGEDDVRAIISTDTALDLSFFIETASSLVDYVDTCDSDDDLSAQQLRQIETYLAAHLYALRDQQYSSKKTADASAVFQGQTAMHLDSTMWGQMAMTLDVSGCLAELNRNSKQGKRTLSMNWLGKAPSDQTDYEDRD